MNGSHTKSLVFPEKWQLIIMNALFVNRTDYSEAIMAEAYKKHLWIRNRNRNLVTLALAAIIFASAAPQALKIFSGEQPFSWIAMALLVAPLGLVWVAFFGQNSVARRTMDGMKQGKHALSLEYSFDKEKINVKTSKEAFSIKYSQCTGCYETENLCLIEARKSLYAIDLRNFDHHERQKFMEFIRPKVRTRKNTSLRR